MVVSRQAKEKRRRKLPGWQRIARPEAKRMPKRLEAERIKCRLARGKDRRGDWNSFYTSLQDIEGIFGVSIEGLIEKAAKRNGGVAKALDLGCGPGVALAELKRKFGKRVKTVGQVLGRTAGEKYPGVDRLLAGTVQELNPREQFDVIFSWSGTTYHTHLKTTAIEKVISWLNPGGTALLDIGRVEHDALSELQTALRQNGIKNWKHVGPLLFFKKPLVKLPK